MKKIFTLIAAAVATLSLNAAGFTLYFGETPVTDGDSYSIGYQYDEEQSGGYTIYSFIQSPELYVSGKGTDVTLHVEADYDIQVCTFGDCTMGKDVTKKGVIPEDFYDLEIHNLVMQIDDPTIPDLPVINTTVTVWETADPSTAVSVNVTLDKTAGIANVTVSENDENAPIFNLMGVMVGRGQGNNLPAGIYVKKGQKFLVR